MKRFVCLLTVLCMAAPACHAASPTSAPTSAPLSVVHADEQKAALAALDAAMAQFETLLDRDDDARHKAAAQVVFDGFKERRAALRQSYDQSRCDELRVDLNLEYQRLASWMKPPLDPTPKRTSTTAPTTLSSQSVP